MIGRRGFRIVEPTRASCGLSRSTPAIEHRRVAAERQLAAALALPRHARAPPGQGSDARIRLPSGDGDPAPEIALGQRWRH